MTPAEFLTHIHFMCRTNSTVFTDADVLALMKIRQDEISKAILETDEDILLIPQTDDLVADQREYPLPSDILSRIKRVEVKLDGTNWIKIDEMDMGQHDKPTQTEANITNSFSNNEGDAFFDLRRKSIYIYSGTITAVTGGIAILVNTYPAAITDLTSTTDMSEDPSTTTHGIPRTMHEIWARGVIIDYKSSREKPIPLTEREQSYKFDLDKAIATLKHGNLDREIIAALPPASDRGNNGANY